jgi:phosphoserine phosphatase RsbU/P
MTDKKKLILSIDDDAATRKYFKTILEENNYSVIEAVNAQKGIEVFKNENPDLVLLDLRMPGMGGLEALRYFTENYPDTPVIVASATDSIDDVVESLRIGAWDFVIKPMHSYNILLHQTQKALERSTLRKQNAEYQDLLLEALNKLKKELESGKNIQMKLLPAAQSKFGEYQFESLVLPSLYLSGDFVDYFKINENYSAFYIADISGHGVSSALVTVFLKSYMNNAKEEFNQKHNKNILQPAHLLQILNTELLKEDFGKFSTLFYGVIDHKKDILTYSNAGHYPAPILNSNGNAKVIESSDIPVGISSDAKYKEKNIKLAKKFSLIFFSDGILDILPQDMLDEKIEFLKGLCSPNKQDFDYFISSLKENSSGLPDDITVLAIERK